MSVRAQMEEGGQGIAIWIGLVALASVLFSAALACATPFAAIATIAATRLKPAPALALTAAAFAVNQAVGYFVLDYPRTWDSFGWGGAIGIAAIGAMLAAALVSRRLGRGLASDGIAFLAAFAAYELLLLSATAFLPSGPEAFSPGVVGWILATDALAFAGLLAAHRLATATGLLPPMPARQGQGA